MLQTGLFGHLSQVELDSKLALDLGQEHVGLRTMAIDAEDAGQRTY